MADSCSALWRALLHATRTVEEGVRRSLQSRGLCPSDYGLLEVLAERGPLSTGELGRELGLSSGSGSVSVALDRLARRRLIARRVSAADARSRLVELTPGGRRVVREARADYSRAIGEATGGLTVRERATLLALLRKLARDSGAD